MQRAPWNGSCWVRPVFSPPAPTGRTHLVFTRAIDAVIANVTFDADNPSVGIVEPADGTDARFKQKAV